MYPTRDRSPSDPQSDPHIKRTTYKDRSFDQKSDDISFNRISSPDTTDSSTTSLNSPCLYRCKLVHIDKPNDLVSSLRDSDQFDSHSRESGSDEENFQRIRTRSFNENEVAHVNCMYLCCDLGLFFPINKWKDYSCVD